MKLTETQLLEKLKQFEEKKWYADGLELISENEDVISKKYYEITRYKISFLIESKNFLEASYIIKEELSVPYIPQEFEEFLLLKKKEVDFALKRSKPSYSVDELDDIDKLDNESLLAILSDLAKMNLNGHHTQFQNILLNSQINDLTKSLLIACLSDAKINEEFYVIKDGVTVKFNPSTIFDIRDSENFKYIEESINKINDVEINTLGVIKKISTMYLLNIYPLVISEQECDYVIAATLIIACQMTNCMVGSSKYDEIIENNKELVMKMCRKLNILLQTI